MTTPLDVKLSEALQQVTDPKTGKDIVSAKMVQSAQLMEDGSAIVVIEVAPSQGSSMEDMRQDAERKVLCVAGVKKASVILTAQRRTPVSGQNPHPAPPKAKRGADPHGMDKNPPVDVPAENIIVVASGKGGVGKSTVSANIAVALAQQGKKVGLLDADIYGPSQPLMMGQVDYKPELDDRKKLIPLKRHGIKMISIGFLVDRTQALIWRGPMAQNAFYQLLRDVAWASEGDKLDYLIIDLPPGTGDIQLTLAQKVKVTGAVIVSTPQDIALIDARRAVSMFGKTDVPVLGIIENMSSYICSSCGHEEHIFGHGGAEDEAKTLGVPFLGAVPLARDVREKADAGIPVVEALPQSASAKAFIEIVKKIVV